MSTRQLEGVATVLLVVVVVALVFGQFLGQPVLLSYVTSDSMEPTLSKGDGFLVVPAFAAGDPEPGDVVVFHAKTLHDGGLTTHRIVDETDGGYVTKGDNNPFTDQDGGEPPVTDGQIVAHVVQVQGEVVAIPHLGTAVTAIQTAVAAPFRGIGTNRIGPVLVFAGIGLFLLAGVLGGGTRRESTRNRNREDVLAVRTVVVFAVVVVTGAATAAMVLPAGVHEFGLVATEQPTDEPGVVAPGETARIEYETHNAGVVPTLVVLEPASEGVAVDPERTVLGHGERHEVTVTMNAPGETGVYLRHVRESRYLLILPPAVLVALHSIHPFLALVAVDLVVAAFVIAAAVGIFGTGQLRIRSGPNAISLQRRIGRLLRRWR